MISSGIKRGLAASAVSALAIAGLPLLASSASAAVGDSIAVASVGPVLNGGDQGGVVVLKTKGVDETKLALKGADLTSSPNNASQSVAIVAGGTSIIANGDPGDSNKTDGLDEITMHISATTPAAGSPVAFAVYEDDAPANGAVDAAEARAQVSMTTSGPLSSIDVAPASQSAAQDIESGAYNVTLKDAAGRTTQLLAANSIAVAGTNGFVPSKAAFTAAQLELGTGSFTGHGPTVGTDNITLTSDHATPVVGKATLVVTKKATLTNDEVDIVTGADSWDGFGGGNFGAPATAVRVDQSSIRIDIKSSDATQDGNSTVTLTATGTGITFGGKPSTTVSTVLDANGVGSLVITPDAGTVQENDSIALSGSFGETLHFERAATQAVTAAADPYFSAVKGSVDVTANVVDQFGKPVTTGFVEAARSGQNDDTAAPQRKAVGSDGSVTFTFTDTKATDGTQDLVTFGYFPDQFASAATQTGTTHIKYTTDGMGSNFKTLLDGTDTESSTYKASDVDVIPLTDAVADNDNASDEFVVPTVTNGEAGSAITVSVDNGAKILKGAETKLSKGSSSITDTVTAGGILTGTYKIVGTKSGVVTVTVTSAHRTEKSQFTVLGQTDPTTARNVAVSGPATLPFGSTQDVFTALVTDAFGNPVPNVSVGSLNIQVTGPAQLQDSDALTNAAGQMNLNTHLDKDAVGDVTIKATGLPWGTQFGAAADQETASSPAKAAEGLPVSSNVATATTTVEAAPAPVKETIVATLAGRSNAGKADVLKVNAPSSANGAVVRLYKVVNGMRKLVKSSSLNASGDRNFTVADKNGKGYTKYVAVVSETAATLGDTTNSKNVR